MIYEYECIYEKIYEYKLLLLLLQHYNYNTIVITIFTQLVD